MVETKTEEAAALLAIVVKEHPLPWKIETDVFGDVYIVDAYDSDIEFDKQGDRELLKLVSLLPHLLEELWKK